MVREAGDQGPEGMAAVANVIRNRLNTGNYGKTVQDVVTAPQQFSPWNKENVGTAADPRLVDPNSDAYNEALTHYRHVVSGDVPDLTKGALNFANPDLTSAPWVKDMVDSGNYTKIGSHVFGTAEPGAGKALSGGQPTRYADSGTTANDAGPQAPSDGSFLGGLGAAAKDTGNWFKGNQDWLVPLLTGVGTMAASPSRYLGSAILQGLGGGAQAYSQQQRLTNEQNRLGLTALQHYQSQYQPTYDANDPTKVSGYIYRPTGAPISLEQYNSSLASAAQKLMPTMGGNVFTSPAGGANAAAPAVQIARQVTQPSTEAAAAPAPATPSKAPPALDANRIPVAVPGDPDSYQARATALTARATQLPDGVPQKALWQAEAGALTNEAVKMRGEGATRSIEAKGQRDTSFLNQGQNFLTQYAQNKQMLDETAKNYQHYQSGPFAERSRQGAAITSTLGMGGTNEVAGYDTAQKSAAVDAQLSAKTYGMEGAPKTGAEMGLIATHSPDKSPTANYKILTDKDAALDYQKDMIEGFKQSGGKDFDSYLSEFQKTHRLEDYVARSRMNMSPFAGTSDTILHSAGVDRPVAIGPETPVTNLKDGAYYIINNNLIRWDAKNQKPVVPFGGK